MTLEEMKTRKEKTGITYEIISERSGIPVSTVQKIFSGATTRPRFETMRKLSRVFSDCESYHTTSDTPQVHEEAAYMSENRYPRQGSYTLEDYYALPDEQRVELIDGVIYDMSAPTNLHQLIAGEVHYQIVDYIKKHGGPCIPFIAPTDVQLDGINDDKTMVQPDVFIVCNRDKAPRSHVIGAPDFVLEVLSPSTRKKDMTKKLQKYTDAGVREYWIIDPDAGRVITYDLEHDCQIGLYTLHDIVPVRIYDGDLKIDFPSMPEYLWAILEK